jgi:hypothetical protein
VSVAVIVAIALVAAKCLMDVWNIWNTTTILLLYSSPKDPDIFVHISIAGDVETLFARGHIAFNRRTGRRGKLKRLR